MSSQQTFVAPRKAKTVLDPKQLGLHRSTKQAWLTLLPSRKSQHKTWARLTFLLPQFQIITVYNLSYTLKLREKNLTYLTTYGSLQLRYDASILKAVYQVNLYLVVPHDLSFSNSSFLHLPLVCWKEGRCSFMLAFWHQSHTSLA